MPIQVKRDIKKVYELGTQFSLKDINNFTTGSVLGKVRNDIANANLTEFQKNLNLLHAQRDFAKAFGKKFNIRSPADEEIFDDLWEIQSDSRDWAKSGSAISSAIEGKLNESYGEVAFIAQGGYSQQDSFKRINDINNKNVVVFSDHHLTAFRNSPNYFEDLGNYALYLKVLEHYLEASDFTIVENGDVEEGLIYEPNKVDSEARRKAYNKKNLPIEDNVDWDDFNDRRRSKRVDILNNIIAHYGDYYNFVADKLVPQNRYVRIAGNHDTYLDDTLKGIIEQRLDTQVYDVLRVNRNNQCRYVIIHGHQFDEVSVQPYASSLGEIISECMAWAIQGADRIWNLSDTKTWYNSEEGNFANKLSSSLPHPLAEVTLDAAIEIIHQPLQYVRDNSIPLIESVLGHPIAWEYFENDDAFNAVFLEVYNGDEYAKLRHMNEIKLYQEYVNKIQLETVPTLVLGHTHEVRQDALRPGSSYSEPGGKLKNPPSNPDLPKADLIFVPSPYYINTGSAGRFANLIWCAEMTEAERHIVSWSEVDGKLKKITWKNHDGMLKHDQAKWIEL